MTLKVGDPGPEEEEVEARGSKGWGARMVLMEGPHPRSRDSHDGSDMASAGMV
jgi:hypothetical protein